MSSMPLQRHLVNSTRGAFAGRCFLLIAVTLLVLCVSAPLMARAAEQEGSSVRPLHGPGYEHLDCSACLTVSRALFQQLNNTLHERPATYLASHRLSRTNQLRRMPYRNSELLVAEVMENFCRSYHNDERVLRLHPKTKVRLYHQQVWKDLSLGVRPSLLEDEFYPPDGYDPRWENETELKRYPIAKIYSPTDQEALRGMSLLAATPTMCATLVEQFEEEIEEMVKVARNLSDIEYGLCGLPLPAATDNATSAAAAEVKASIRPITNICSNAAVLQAAAHADQLRWSQFMRREQRRLARVEEKRRAAKRAAGQPEDEAENAASKEQESDAQAAVEAKRGGEEEEAERKPVEAVAEPGSDKAAEEEEVEEGDL